LKKILILTLLAVLASSFFAIGAIADNGSKVISTPVSDDLFETGGRIAINAPVDGDVFALGGMVTINAPIEGDIIVAGGTIDVTGNVKGKIIALGGRISVGGNAEKAIIAGGNIDIRSTAVIDKYARIAGGRVSNAGTIKGELLVSTDNFQNSGSVGRVESIQTSFQTETASAREFFQKIRTLLSILITIGFLILGLVLLKLFPNQFANVEEEIKKSTIVKVVVGFVLIIVTVVIVILLAITIIGFPLAAILGMLFIIALMTSGLFVALAFGRKIGSWLKFETGDIWLFVLGFVILRILFLIPILGFFIHVVVVSLGFGAIFYALRKFGIPWK
jgi:uncharacterized membrane protein YidH (DUF202 family)